MLPLYEPLTVQARPSHSGFLKIWNSKASGAKCHLNIMGYLLESSLKAYTLYKIMRIYIYIYMYAYVYVCMQYVCVDMHTYYTCFRKLILMTYSKQPRLLNSCPTNIMDGLPVGGPQNHVQMWDPRVSVIGFRALLEMTWGLSKRIKAPMDNARLLPFS